jgi:hypothetical protein
MLDWDDEILALTEPEIEAFRRIGSSAVVNTYLDLVRKVLSSSVAVQRDMRRAIDAYLASLQAKKDCTRLVAILRAKVLRRWSAECSVRQTFRLATTAACDCPSTETASFAVRAQRLFLLGAPPEIA